MRLDIKNVHKLVDSAYHSGRFVCTKGIETETSYRFQFVDNDSLSARYLWVEINRNGTMNDGKWEYRLNYLNAPIHLVTADWLSIQGNAYKLMADCLKNSIK